MQDFQFSFLQQIEIYYWFSPTVLSPRAFIFRADPFLLGIEIQSQQPDHQYPYS